MLNDYIEQLGSFADLMPESMTEEYQHICVEYLLLLETHDTSKTQRILRNGILSRFRSLDKLPAKPELFETYVDSLVGGLEATKKTLANSTELLRKKLKMRGDTKSMDAFLRSLQAYRKIRAAIDLSPEQSLEQFREAEVLLISSLKINTFDYMAYFQLGWLYLWLLDEKEKAEECFDQAAVRSMKHDEYFHALASRHLAFSLFISKKYDQALEVIQDTRKFTDYEHVLVEYEHLVYALHAGQPELVAENLEKLSNDHSLYYLLIQTEPKFQEYGSLQAIPELIRKNKIARIKKIYDKRWENSSMRLIQMEEGCNVNRVYLGLLKKHLPELEQVPFIELDAFAKKQGDRIFDLTQARIAEEIDKRFSLYEDEINAKRDKYAWVNTAGKYIFTGSLYIIVGLLVLGIYLVMDRYFIPGDSGITINNWMIGLSGMILALIVGFIFTTFETNQVQKLYAKQKLVDDALNKLHKEGNGVSRTEKK